MKTIMAALLASAFSLVLAGNARADADASASIDAKVDGDKVEVETKYKAKVTVNTPFGEKTLASYSASHTETFEIREKKYTKEKDYGVFKVIYTIRPSKVCVKGVAKLAGHEISIGQVCAKISAEK
jgi:hypothetical protein